MHLLRPARILAAVAIAASTAAAAGSLASGGSGVLLPTDRVVSPAGRITPLDYFPTGAAVSPDGSRVVAIAGGAIYGAGGNENTVDVIDASSGQVLQRLEVGDAFQSVVYSRDGSTVYVAGGADGVVHVFSVLPGGLLKAGTDLAVGDFVTSIVVDHADRYLWAAESENARVTRIDLTSGDTKHVELPQADPDQLALSRDESTLYVTDWRHRSVATIDTAQMKDIGDVTVGSHPAGVGVLSDGTLVVADANDATLATLAPGAGTATFTQLRQIVSGGDSPSSLVVGPGDRLYVTLAGDDAVAVLDRNVGNATTPWSITGLIPTGWYPTDVTLSPDQKTLYVVTGKGLGHSAAGTSPYVTPDPATLSVNGAYATSGDLEAVPVPSDADLESMTHQVRDNLRAYDVTSAQTPVLGPDSPIKHIIYVTRENKTYDTDLGDLHPGPGNALTLFGESVTPNLHALERGFVESQDFTYPATASTTGHLWEDAGGTSDVFERSNGDGNLDDDWHHSTNYPDTGLLVEQVLHAGQTTSLPHLTVRTYNEELAQQSGLMPPEVQATQAVFPNYDLRVSDTSREKGWESEFNKFESGDCTGDLAAYVTDCQLPSLEYVYLGEDHTTVEDKPGYPTVEAQVADNDYATGKLIDTVSHSKDWSSTLVIVVEDDPQSTGDDVSAYHGFIAMASPWVKRGFISTTPYNLAGVVGAIDDILGLPPITDFAATSNPLSDLFIPNGAQPDLTPYDVDGSAETVYPFTPLPGSSSASDPEHGIYSLTGPDEIDPALASAVTWATVHHEPIPTVRSFYGNRRNYSR